MITCDVCNKRITDSYHYNQYDGYETKYDICIECYQKKRAAQTRMVER